MEVVNDTIESPHLCFGDTASAISFASAGANESTNFGFSNGLYFDWARTPATMLAAGRTFAASPTATPANRAKHAIGS
jgi:hypothetical protein